MSLDVSSNAAIAVDVVKLFAPLCNPRTILPSFWYCSIGNQNRSRIPWTVRKCQSARIFIQRITFFEWNNSWTMKFIRPICSMILFRSFIVSFAYLHSCTNECIGPTPPSKLGNWFFFISCNHSDNKNVTSLSKPKSPCRCVNLFSLSSEQFNCAKPIKSPANGPWVRSTRFPW